jgi:hypothetical protein
MVRTRGLKALVVMAAAAAIFVPLTVLGLSYGGSNPGAFSHVYTLPSNGNATHLHIDADVTNGDRPCDPIDEWASVDSGIHSVGVCIEDYDTSGEPKTGTCTTGDHTGCGTGSIQSFELHIRYSGDPDAVPATTINTAATMEDCAPCLDANPDANNGDDVTGYKLGLYWDCTGLTIALPLGEDPSTPNVADARIICNNQVTRPDRDLDADPGLLATLQFTVSGTGVDTIDFGPIDDVNKNSVGKPLPGSGVAYCGTTVTEGQIGCFGARIFKNYTPTPTPTPITPTPTPTPITPSPTPTPITPSPTPTPITPSPTPTPITPSPTPTPITPSPTPSNTPTPTITPTPRPYTCFWADNHGRDTSLGITDSTWVFEGPGGFYATGTGVRHFRDRVFVFGRFSGGMVAGYGKCPSGPAAAWAMTLTPPWQVLHLWDSAP